MGGTGCCFGSPGRIRDRRSRWCCPRHKNQTFLKNPLTSTKLKQAVQMVKRNRKIKSLPLNLVPCRKRCRGSLLSGRVQVKMQNKNCSTTDEVLLKQAQKGF